MHAAGKSRAAGVRGGSGSARRFLKPCRAFLILADGPKGKWNSLMGSELLEHSWTDAREGLQVRFGQECFQRWLADITVISSDAGHVRLGVANRFLQEWIETRYLDGIREVLEGQAGSCRSISPSIPFFSGSSGRNRSGYLQALQGPLELPARFAA